MATKRPMSPGSDESKKPLCKFGSLCYRKNPDHLREFAHPFRTQNPAKKKNESYSGASSSKKTRLQPAVIVPKHPDGAFLLECYDMPFPDDFFDLWAVCCELNPQNPREALIPLFNQRLVGPYDALAMKESISCSDKKAFNLHYRYFYDPPEFQTLMVEEGTDNHMGYFRDDPNELPVFVANSLLGKRDMHPWKLIIAGANLLQILHNMVKEKLKSKLSHQEKATYDDLMTLVSKVCQNRHFVSYKSKRKTRALGNVLHHVGMVVPFDEKTEVGYRPITVTNIELRRLMSDVAAAEEGPAVQDALSRIQELITLVNFANDECDYGMGLELGLDLFLFGNERLHKAALFLLSNAYTLLRRDKFLEIVNDHIANRKNNIVVYLAEEPSSSSGIPLDLLSDSCLTSDMLHEPPDFGLDLGIGD